MRVPRGLRVLGVLLALSFTGAPATHAAYNRTLLISQRSVVLNSTTLNTSEADSILVTNGGASSITALTPLAAGRTVLLRFAGVTTVVHGASTIVLDGGVNFVSLANDTLGLYCDGTKWYYRSGPTFRRETAVVDPGGGDQGDPDEPGTLADLIDTAGATVKDIELRQPGTYIVSTDLVVPSNLRIVIAKGAVLAIDSGKSVTFAGQLSAGPYQIFSGSGTAVLGTGSVEEVYPEWWRASGDSTDQAAIVAGNIAAVGKRFVFDKTKTYHLTAAVNPTQDSYWIGSGATIVQDTADEYIINATGTIGSSLGTVINDLALVGAQKIAVDTGQGGNFSVGQWVYLNGYTESARELVRVSKVASDIVWFDTPLRRRMLTSSTSPVATPKRFVLSGFNFTGGKGLQLTACAEARLEDIKVYSIASPYRALSLAGSSQNLFRNVQLVDNFIGLRLDSFSDNNTFERLLSKNNGSWGVWLDSSCANSFEGARVEGNGRLSGTGNEGGVVLTQASTDGGSHFNRFSNCFVVGNDNWGYYAYLSNDISIHGGMVLDNRPSGTGSGYGAQFYTSMNCSVENVKFRGNGASGGSQVAFKYGSDGCTLSGGSVTDTHSGGVVVASSSYCTIDGVTIRYNEGYGVAVQKATSPSADSPCYGTTITNCQITHNQDDGVAVLSAYYTTIAHNTIMYNIYGAGVTQLKQTGGETVYPANTKILYNSFYGNNTDANPDGVTLSIENGSDYNEVIGNDWSNQTVALGDGAHDIRRDNIDGADPTVWTRNVAAPSAAADACTPGDIAVAAGYVYFCYATDTWLRAVIATWGP